MLPNNLPPYLHFSRVYLNGAHSDLRTRLAYVPRRCEHMPQVRFDALVDALRLSY